MSPQNSFSAALRAGDAHKRWNSYARRPNCKSLCAQRGQGSHQEPGEPQAGALSRLHGAAFPRARWHGLRRWQLAGVLLAATIGSPK